MNALAVASGGLFGTGLLIVSQQLPHAFQVAAYPLIATLSSVCSLTVRVGATQVIRRFSRRLWEKEHAAVVQQAIHAIDLLKDELLELENEPVRNERAERRARAHIQRLQLVKIEALGAKPFERPWLTDLKKPVEGD